MKAGEVGRHGSRMAKEAPITVNLDPRNRLVNLGHPARALGATAGALALGCAAFQVICEARDRRLVAY